MRANFALFGEDDRSCSRSLVLSPFRLLVVRPTEAIRASLTGAPPILRILDQFVKLSV